MQARSALFASFSSRTLTSRAESLFPVRRVSSSSECPHILQEPRVRHDESFDAKTVEESNFGDELQIVTWNIAAPNNNPFEFWATHESDDYLQLMTAVQTFLDNPGEKDVEIFHVFTSDMYSELRKELSLHGVLYLNLLDEYWEKNLRDRRMISNFLRDTSFGEKRLISMPDRITGSVRIDGGQEICR
jgi:hypothetical protein